MRARILSKSENYILHPVFLALVFILNTIRGKLVFAPVSVPFAIIFSIVILCVVFISYRICLFQFKEKVKAGVFSSVLLFFLLWYFDIYHHLFTIPFIQEIVSEWLFQKFHIVLLSIIILLLFLIYFSLKITKRIPSLLNNYLNILFLLYIFIELYKLSFDKKHKVNLLNPVNVLSIQPPVNQQKDIYYIVMDSYTSTKSLKKYWNYDNKEFTDFLKSKGFFIAENSTCNYNSTPFSISAALNMSYSNVENYEQAQKTQVADAFELVKNNLSAQLLAENGYAIKNYSLFDILTTTAFYTDPFYHKTNLFDRTIFFLFSERLHLTKEHETLLELGRINMDIIVKINSTKETSSPTFYYVHLMMPHYPYFFDEAGNNMPESYTLSDENVEEKYLTQLKYTNRLIMQTINTILTRSKTQPIIVLQGDHGFRELKNMSFENRLQESQTIFNAYLLPHDTLRVSPYDSISPVNTFRVIFNNYFNTGFLLLKDTSYNTELKNEM